MAAPSHQENSQLSCEPLQMVMNQYPKQYLLISLNKLMMIRKISDPCLVVNQIRIPMKKLAATTLTVPYLMKSQIPIQTKTLAATKLASFLSSFYSQILRVWDFYATRQGRIVFHS